MDKTKATKDPMKKVLLEEDDKLIKSEVDEQIRQTDVIEPVT